MATDVRSLLVAAKPAAEVLGVPYTTIRDLVFKGKLPVVKVGNAWYFDRRDLEQFIEQNKETYA